MYLEASFSDLVQFRLEKILSFNISKHFTSHGLYRLIHGLQLQEENEDRNAVGQNQLLNFGGIEVQTAPLSDCVLPGVIRQVIKE